MVANKKHANFKDPIDLKMSLIDSVVQQYNKSMDFSSERQIVHYARCFIRIVRLYSVFANF